MNYLRPNVGPRPTLWGPRLPMGPADRGCRSGPAPRAARELGRWPSPRARARFGRTHDLREPERGVPPCLRGGKISSGSERPGGCRSGRVLGVVVGNRGSSAARTGAPPLRLALSGGAFPGSSLAGGQQGPTEGGSNATAVFTTAAPLRAVERLLGRAQRRRSEPNLSGGAPRYSWGPGRGQLGPSPGQSQR